MAKLSSLISSVNFFISNYKSIIRTYFFLFFQNKFKTVPKIELALKELFRDQEVTFIQIGSNVGVMKTDPLCAFIQKNGWKGVLIEPVPWIFQKLQENYRGIPGLHFENVAISDQNGIVEFFALDPSTETSHGFRRPSGKGSLEAALVHSHFPNKKKLLCPIQVEAVTFQDLIDKYEIHDLDLLHIDTEGHDGVILHSINFDKIKPKAILFEHLHLDGPYTTKEKYKMCIAHLESKGYSILVQGWHDTLMVLIK